MLKFINLTVYLVLLVIFLILSACSINQSLLDSSRNGEEASQEAQLKKYYSQLEERKISLGLLRQDGGGTDTPFDVNDIVEAFEQLAFYNEYSVDENKLLPKPKPVNLTKWMSNTNISVRFGNSINRQQKNKDLRDINSLIRTLSKATNHNINITEQNVNMYIVIANQKEIRDLITKISLLRPEFDPKNFPIIIQIPIDIHCIAMSSMSGPTKPEISSSLVIIRNELPNLMRKACIQEEVAQSLGLTNDSHIARPSIFNDDDEFATLTKFDEILLQILYDDRLPPGIPRAEAHHLVEQIASEKLK